MGCWPVVLVLAVYVGLVLLPVAWPFTTLLQGSPPEAGPIWDPELHGPLMANSLRLAGTVTAATSLLAGPLALLLYRTRLPLRLLWLGALLVPLLVPPYILGVGVLHLLTPRIAVGFTGAAVTMTVWLLPLALLFTGTGLRLVTRSQEEAALLDANWLGVWRHVTLPLALPHAVAGALFVLVLALGEFGVPVLFQYRVYPGVIFAQFAAFYDFRQAVVTSVPLVLVAVTAALMAQFLLGRNERTGAADEPARVSLGAAGPFLAGGAALIALAGLAPLLKMSLGVGSAGALLRGLGRVWAQALLTFGIAAAGAVAAVLTALAVAWVAVRVMRRGEWLLVGQLPLFAVPAVIVGLGLIRLWNELGWRGLVYTSPLILTLGYTARFTPLLVPLLAASYRQLPAELDEAAQLDGAGRVGVLCRIHVPLLRPALGTAGLLASVLAVGEVPISMLIAPPGRAPLAVRFFTLITNAPAEHLAALAVVTTLLALLPVMLWIAIQGWHGKR